jgi:hypothetical protein
MKRSGSRNELRMSIIESRQDLSSAKRVVIKAGTSVVSTEDGRFSLVRLSSIVEQIADLRRAGVEVIFVSSGAVGAGRMLLRKQALLTSNFRQQLDGNANDDGTSQAYASSACASAGQLGLMSLFETLFQQVVWAHLIRTIWQYWFHSDSCSYVSSSDDSFVIVVGRWTWQFLSSWSQATTSLTSREKLT